MLALIACLLVWAPTAWGHAALVSASPAAGSVLDRAPAAIVLRFSEPVSHTALQLFDAKGDSLHTGPVSTTGTQMVIAVPDSLADGAYLLSWRVVSADGHPVGGTLDFAIGAATIQAAQAPEANAPGMRDAAIWLSRWLTYVCLFVAAGAALFRAGYPDRRQSWAWAAVAACLLLLPADLALQGLDLMDAPWSALAQPAPWSAALASTYALTLGLMMLALLAIACALRCRDATPARIAAITSLALIGAALASSGHAGTAPPQWLSRPTVALHAIMAIAWVGTLIPLRRTLARVTSGPRLVPTTNSSGETRTGAGPIGEAQDQTAGRGNMPLPAPLAQFSRWISGAVGLLVASGLILIWLQFEQPADLWRSAYGRVLMAKLALVALLLCLAALNRWRLTRPALRGSVPARRRLRRTILLEIALAALVLAVVSLWRFTPPPRNLEAHPTALAALADITLADARVSAHITPAGPGWIIQLTDPTGQPLRAQAVTLILNNPAAGIEPLRRTARHLGGARWQADLPPLPATGQWQLHLDILIDDFDQITLEGPEQTRASPGPAQSYNKQH